MFAHDNNIAMLSRMCKGQGIKFIPIVAESLGGWHKVALEQFSKLGRALAHHIGQEEGE